MKLAHVVQRYGREVAGGSEALCSQVARRLAARHDVTVLTTCARDYVTWRNEFSPGESVEEGVRVLRFRCRQRDMTRFREISQIAFSRHARPDEEAAWFRESGPYSPSLLEHIESRASDYDGFVFWTYRYHPSFAGLPRVADRAILVPTAEEDSAIRIRALRDFFRRPAGLFFLTEEEAELVRRIAEHSLPRSVVIGSGVEPATGTADTAQVEVGGLADDDDFVLYLGRIDENKGCRTMFDFYLRYVAETGSRVPLVVAGRPAMPVPEHPQIRILGFVSDEVRRALLAHARLLLMPSPYESLSLVLLEAWNHGRPVLVNGRCAVLRGQVRRADGGLYYDHYAQFCEGITMLLAERAVGDRLGAQGRAYVDDHYRWPHVMEKIEAGLSRWLPRGYARPE